MTLDLTKPVMTRSGHKVRILATDMRSTHPVVAIVTDEEGNESVDTYYLNGSYLGDRLSTMDLVNAVEAKGREADAAIAKVMA